MTRDQLQSLAQGFESVYRKPPQTALYAFASLCAEDKIVGTIGETFTADQRTVWVLTGVTDTSLIRVQASSACENWCWEWPGKTPEREGEQLEATLWPLSAVRSLNVTRVHDTTTRGDNSQYGWETDWAVTMRDGKTISIPSSAAFLSTADTERVARLIAVIRSHL